MSIKYLQRGRQRKGAEDFFKREVKELTQLLYVLRRGPQWEENRVYDCNVCGASALKKYTVRDNEAGMLDVTCSCCGEYITNMLSKNVEQIIASMEKRLEELTAYLERQNED